VPIYRRTTEVSGSLGQVVSAQLFSAPGAGHRVTGAAPREVLGLGEVVAVLVADERGAECAHAAEAHVRAIASVAAMRQAVLRAFFVLIFCVRSSANNKKGRGFCSS
jgi:hypothetical protein